MPLPTPTQTSTGTGTSASTCAATLGVNSLLGSLLIAVISVSALAGTSTVINNVTDNKGNTWVAIDNSLTTAASNIARGAMFYCPNAIAGVTTITANFNQAATLSAIAVAEYAGLIASPLDQHTYIAGSGGTPQAAGSGGTGSLAQANELVIGWVAGQGTSAIGVASPNPGGNATLANNSSTIFAEFSDVKASSTSSVAATYTVTSASQVQWVCGIATFKITAIAQIGNDMDIQYDGLATKSGGLVHLGSEALPSLASATQLFPHAPLGTRLAILTIRGGTATMTFDGAGIDGVNGGVPTIPTATVGVDYPAGTYVFQLNDKALRNILAIGAAVTSGFVEYLGL